MAWYKSAVMARGRGVKEPTHSRPLTTRLTIRKDAWSFDKSVDVPAEIVPPLASHLGKAQVPTYHKSLL